jgi:hypothetical protein
VGLADSGDGRDHGNGSHEFLVPGATRESRESMTKNYQARDMEEYRYRTSVLIGPWRRSRTIALHDAIVANQAFIDPDPPHELRWRVGAYIEERDDHSARVPHALNESEGAAAG